MHVRGSVFKIVELDLWTYNYMNENKDMFTQDAIDGAKCYLENKGLLNPQKQEKQTISTTNHNESINDQCLK